MTEAVGIPDRSVYTFLESSNSSQDNELSLKLLTSGVRIQMEKNILPYNSLAIKIPV